MIAYCWASGEIEFVQSPGPVPFGALAFADNIILRPDLSSEDFVALVTARARTAHDNETLLVPGIPEAEDQVQAREALQEWVEQALKKPGKAA
ncbi:MAG: hypothetical protein K5905_25690 [Roseibium sp.]|uniref:hypothetical protein n=1 Tax=Roseibium sp. TaxID=1936156 RepID=UPI002620310E|nr:hypothetical protein [Roseibium sp.]MCV0428862.1 hypothetical protein [Roseibium sp.]